MSRLDEASIAPMVRAFQNGDPNVTRIQACCRPWREQPEDDPWFEQAQDELPIRMRACGQLASAINQNTTIEELELIGFPADMCNAVAEALKHNVTLQSVVIYDAGGGDAAGIPFAEAMRHNTTLKSLKIAWVSQGFDGVGDGACAALAEALRYNSTLRSLELAGDFRNTTLRRLLDCTRISSRHLEMYGDGADALLVAVAEGMKRHSTIRHLTLVSEFIGDAAVAAIAEALRNNLTLLSLTCHVDEMLDGHLVSDATGMVLAEALKRNIALHSLIVQGPASLVRAFPLADAMKHNPILQLAQLTIWSPASRDEITLDAAVLEAFHCNHQLPTQWRALACTARSRSDFSLATLGDIIIRTRVFAYFLPLLCTLKAKWPLYR